MSLLFNILSRLIITFLPKSKHLLILYMAHSKRSRNLPTLMIGESEILMEQTPEVSLDHRCLLPLQTYVLLSLLGTEEGQVFLTALPRDEWVAAFFFSFLSLLLAQEKGRECVKKHGSQKRRISPKG